MDKENIEQQEIQTTAPEKIFALPENLGNALVEYLVSRPYREVAPLIQALGTLQQIEVGSAAPKSPPSSEMSAEKEVVGKPLASAAKRSKAKKNETTEDK